jgi:hypothetical protein
VGLEGSDAPARLSIGLAGSQHREGQAAAAGLLGQPSDTSAANALA